MRTLAHCRDTQVSFGGVGALLTWRRPGHLVGWVSRRRGPGIAGTLACLEDGGMRGEIRVQYTCRAGRQILTAALGDLRGHNLLGLARAVFGYCRERQLTVEAVDCSARGAGSALAEDRRFLQQVMTAAGVTPPELGAPAAWGRLAPEIAKIAIGEGLTVEPGSPIDLTVTAGAGVVGRGQMRVRNNPDTVR